MKWTALGLAAATASSALSQHILVGDQDGSKIVRFEWPSGALVDHFVAQGISALDTTRPMTLGPDGTLYVASEGTNSVLRYDGRTGKPLGTFVQPGAGGLDLPTGLAFGPDGHLYVSSRDSHEVLRYNGTTGAFLGVFVQAGAGGIDWPHHLFFDSSGSLIVSGFGSGSVVRYNGVTGAFVDYVFAPGTPGLSGPAGILQDDSGRFLVCSYGNGQILARDPGGAPYVLVPAGVSPFSGPEQAVVAPDGSLLVVYAGGNGGVARFAANGTLLGVLVVGLAGGLSDEPTTLLVLPAPCPADIDQNDAVNTNDFFAFLGLYQQGCP